jgi:hypothetical protein
MTTIYKVFNAADGTYIEAATKEQCVKVLGFVAYKFYLSHTHNIPYVLITKNEDGSETWKAPDGTELISPYDANVIPLEIASLVDRA